MTTKQRMSILLDRWPAACRAQGWDHKRRDLRLRAISDAVGREITSMNDLDNSADIDKVYAHLGHLADQVADTIETLPAGSIEVSAGHGSVEQHDSAGYRRRITWLIKHHGQELGGIPYVLALARHKFHLTAGLSTIEDLTTTQLHQLMITLAARKSKSRRARAAAAAPEPELVESSGNNPF